MTEITSVEYRDNPDFDERTAPTNENALIGGYFVKYEDDYTVLIPHSGWPRTVSAEPLDVNDPEHRQIICDHADRLRANDHRFKDPRDIRR